MGDIVPSLSSMLSTSTIYTIGTALHRAHDNEVGVEVMVDGHWIHGDVSAVDGHGLVLHCSDGSLAMIRIESIDCVLVRQTAAFEGHDELAPQSAHPMPAPSTDAHPAEPQVVRPRASIERAWDDRDSLVRGA